MYNNTTHEGYMLLQRRISNAAEGFLDQSDTEVSSWEKVRHAIADGEMTAFLDALVSGIGEEGRSIDDSLLPEGITFQDIQVPAFKPVVDAETQTVTALQSQIVECPVEMQPISKEAVRYIIASNNGGRVVLSFYTLDSALVIYDFRFRGYKDKDEYNRPLLGIIAITTKQVREYTLNEMPISIETPLTRQFEERHAALNVRGLGWYAVTDEPKTWKEMQESQPQIVGVPLGNLVDIIAGAPKFDKQDTIVGDLTRLLYAGKGYEKDEFLKLMTTLITRIRKDIKTTKSDFDENTLEAKVLTAIEAKLNEHRYGIATLMSVVRVSATEKIELKYRDVQMKRMAIKIAPKAYHSPLEEHEKITTANCLMLPGADILDIEKTFRYLCIKAADPECKFNLEKIESLNMSYCGLTITNMPIQLFWLTGLKEVELTGNSELTGLPQNVVNWKDIAHLNMKYCPIDTLPDKLQSMFVTKYQAWKGYMEDTGKEDPCSPFTVYLGFGPTGKLYENMSQTLYDLSIEVNRL